MGQCAEKGKALHAREAAEIDVGTLPFHIHHSSDAALHLLHSFVGGLRMQYVLHGIVVFLADTEAVDAQIVVLDERGKHVALEHLMVFLGIHAQEYLLLQPGKLLALLLVEGGKSHHLRQSGIENLLSRGHRQGPTNESTLAKMVGSGVAEQLIEQPELVEVEQVEVGDEHRTHEI